MEEEQNEARISRCPSCSEPLRWERVSGENVESWIGRCECGLDSCATPSNATDRTVRRLNEDQLTPSEIAALTTSLSRQSAFHAPPNLLRHP
jgi:hypothetical protein